MDQTKDKNRTVFETIELSGSQLVERVRELLREGNVRTVKISAEDGDFSLEMPVTIGVLAGGAVALAAPWLAVLGVIAAMVTHVKLEVERDPDAPAAKPDDAAKPEGVGRDD